jgi:glycosyl hydrolase family 99
MATACPQAIKLLSVALVLLLLGAAIQPVQAKTAIGVIAPWYGDGDSDGWHNWGEMGHDPTQIIDGQRDIASAHYPIMGPYKSRSDNTENWHLGFAEAVGLDVLMIDYYTQNLPGKSIYYDFTINMLGKAIGSNVKIALQYEPKIHTQNWVQNYYGDRVAMTNAVKEDLRHIHDVLAASPAYWRVDNKPVVQIFGQTWTLTTAEWADVAATLNSENRQLYYMGDAVVGGNLASWYPQFQSHMNWSLYNSSIAGDQGWNTNYTFASNVNAQPLNWAAAGSGRQAVGVAWPGFDDSGVDGWGAGARLVDRAGGEFYRASLEALNNQDHDWRLFATMNDWNEGTELEPSREYGYQYALATQNHIEAWKGIQLDDDAPRDVTEQYFPQLVTLWDRADDLGMLQSYDSVSVDNANVPEFAGDGARFFRGGSMTESYIQYELADDIGGFRVPGWFVTSEAVNDFLFYTSADGTDWTAHPPLVTNKGGGAWTEYFYENSGALPAGHKYLRIQWQTSAGQWWSPQIGEVKMYDIAAVPVSPLEGDLDGDGFVGIGDLNIVLNAWNQFISLSDISADPSGDGFVGIEDLNIVLGNWNAGTPPIVNVPEPASLGLLFVGGGLILLRRNSTSC